MPTSPAAAGADAGDGLATAAGEAAGDAAGFAAGLAAGDAAAAAGEAVAGETDATGWMAGGEVGFGAAGGLVTVIGCGGL